MTRYEFESEQQCAALTRGALAGMAEAVYLDDGHTGENVVTVLFDCTLEDYGVEALIQSFGMPDYPGKYYGRGDTDERQYSLNLEVRMVNGKFEAFEFDVIDQVKGQPRGGIIVVSGLSISNDEGLKGGGNFDVDVDGRGEWVNIPLPLG